MTTTVSRLVARGSFRVGAILAALAPAAAAWAQNQGPRQPKLDSPASPVIGYLLLAVFAGILIAISLYPSKRTHTDL
jgi:hypothetical protein